MKKKPRYTGVTPSWNTSGVTPRQTDLDETRRTSYTTVRSTAARVELPVTDETRGPPPVWRKNRREKSTANTNTKSYPAIFSVANRISRIAAIDRGGGQNKKKERGNAAAPEG